MKSFFARIAALVFAAASIAANAGGPLSVCSTVPTKYAGAGVVTLNYDGGGTLGSRTKAQADALVTSSVALWTNVATSTVGLARGPDLRVPSTATPVDVTSANYLTYIGNSTYSDGLNPVVYDTDGSITNLLLGPGSSTSVLGFAGSAWYDYGTYCQYAEGRAVINGAISVSDTTMSVVLAHEMGHLIGLDHTQIDGVQGLPTYAYPLMYPIAYRGTASLHADDIAAVTALYPDVNVSSVYGTLSGTFVNGSGTPILGTNIWARNETTSEVFSVISDYLGAGSGYFKMLLTPGTYTLHAEGISTDFTGGSGMGPYADDLTGLSFQPPNYSGANGSGTPLAVTMTSPSSITITAGCNATVTFRSTGTGTMGTTCAPPATPSAMTSPANGSTLPGSSVTFTWNAGVGTITERLLTVGTTSGGSDIYSGYQGAGLSRLVTGIPTNGSTIYVRLMSFINGAWQTNNYTYTAANVVAPSPSAITAPTPGTTLASSSVLFEWSAGGLVTSRTLSVGSNVGGSQYYGPTSQGSALSRLVSGLPTDGSTVYVRLSQVVNGATVNVDYTYTAATVAAPSAMTSPAAGSTLTGASVTFNWSAGSGVTERYFTVGTSSGGSDIYGAYQGAGLSRTVTGIPTDGRTIYVRLASWVNGAWSNANYTYTAFGTGAPPPCTGLVASSINSPTPGSTLTGASATFGWTAGCSVTDRYLAIGSTAGASDIFGGYQGAGLSKSVVGIPTDGRTIYVTLSSWVGGGWQTSAVTYRAFGTGSGPVTPTKSNLTSPTPGSMLSGSSVTFQWDAGAAVSERYLAIGSSAGASDIYGGYQGAGLSKLVSTLPVDGRTVYVTLSSWVSGGWQAATATYTAATGGAPPVVPQSVVSSPAPGSTLGTSATFNWSAGLGVTERYFTVGTTSGGAQIYGGYQGAGLSRAVTGLPTGSVTVYVRLMSYVGGSWIVENYTYTSAP